MWRSRASNKRYSTRLDVSPRQDKTRQAGLHAYIRQQELVSKGRLQLQLQMNDTDKRLTSSMADAMRVMEEKGKAATLDDDIEEVNGLPAVQYSETC